LYYCSIEGAVKTLLDIGIRGLGLVAGMALLEAIGLLLVEFVELLDVFDIFLSTAAGDWENTGIILLGFSLFDFTGVCALSGVTIPAEVATKASASRLRIY